MLVGLIIVEKASMLPGLWSMGTQWIMWPFQPIGSNLLWTISTTLTASFRRTVSSWTLKGVFSRVSVLSSFLFFFFFLHIMKGEINKLDVIQWLSIFFGFGLCQWAQMVYCCKVQQLQILKSLSFLMALKIHKFLLHILSLRNGLCCHNSKTYLKRRLVSISLFVVFFLFFFNWLIYNLLLKCVLCRLRRFTEEMDSRWGMLTRYLKARQVVS